jgi:hypothetical protein
MDPISKLAKTIGVVRRSAAESRTLGTGRKPEGNPAQSSATGRTPTQRLRADVARRLRSIGSSTDQRSEAARVIIEQVLLNEFGPQALTSERFAHTVSSVRRVMESDPGVKAELDSLIGELTADSSGP